jgi:hypothetical protein
VESLDGMKNKESLIPQLINQMGIGKFVWLMPRQNEKIIQMKMMDVHRQYYLDGKFFY